MSVISGIGGVVDGVSALRQWQIASKKADLATIAHSASLGAMDRVLGNKDWNGSYSAYGHTPVHMPGEALNFLGSIEGTVGATGTAIVDSVEISWDIEGGKPIEHVVNFSGNGALALGAAVATDVTVVEGPPSIGCILKTGTVIAVPVWTEVPEIRTMKLTISAANKEYASSTTAGLKKRVKGNIDATMSFTFYGATFVGVLAENTVIGLRMFVDATTYWEILWGIVNDVSGLLVDREGAGIVGGTVNLGLKSFTLVAAAETAGSIKKPSGATYWPFA